MMCSVQKACGGCPTLHLIREDEHERKRRRVEANLTNVGIGVPVPLPAAGMNRFGYRNRLRMRVVDGRATLFNRSKLDGCPALRPQLWAAICQVIEVSSQAPELLETIDHLEVRVGDKVDDVGLSLACSHSGQSSANSVSVDHQSCSKALQAVLGERWKISCKADQRQRTLTYYLDSDLSVAVPINAFVQVNSEVNRMLVAHVAEESRSLGASSFLDLFAGAGNFCLPLLAAGLSGHAVERNTSAVIELMARGNEGRLTVSDGDVEACLEDLQPADVVVVNPPRRGVGTHHDLIAQLATSGIVMVSCDSTSLASDLSRFVSKGFEVERLATFDMFPGTEHIETVATLRRVSAV